ncbi:zinc-finger homeodomain protein 10-like [Lotus japonicus]|uniref:zinc-finger homeodomain protein 10-like n=1 Tax=Lotus japonicus TaxID=34305 RepID=UPI00258C7D4E|nr:zinc-finger homeodomain protein 10-like [Lotus japonicus]
MQKKDEDFVQNFFNEIGIERWVLKVWMHNNKNTFGKRDGSNEINNNINNAGFAKSSFAKENHDLVINNNSNISEINGNGNCNHGAEDPIHHHYQNHGGATVRANGSS